jgi:hypothetical protein
MDQGAERFEPFGKHHHLADNLNSNSFLPLLDDDDDDGALETPPTKLSHTYSSNPTSLLDNTAKNNQGKKGEERKNKMGPKRPKPRYNRGYTALLIYKGTKIHPKKTILSPQKRPISQTQIHTTQFIYGSISLL